MNGVTGFKYIGLGAIAWLLTSCASTGSLVESPHVTLRDVKVTELDFDGQTFLLDFDVTNPNPFPLPVSAISYGVELDGHRFASGETQGDFSFPASSDGGFSISVGGAPGYSLRPYGHFRRRHTVHGCREFQNKWHHPAAFCRDCGRTSPLKPPHGYARNHARGGSLITAESH
jgi:hypothetical protein